MTHTLHVDSPLPRPSLTQTQASGEKGRGEVCSQSAGQKLEVDPGRLEGHCKQLYYMCLSGLHSASFLWTGAWRVRNERNPDSGWCCRLHQGLEHSVWHCGGEYILLLFLLN